MRAITLALGNAQFSLCVGAAGTIAVYYVIQQSVENVIVRSPDKIVELLICRMTNYHSLNSDAIKRNNSENLFADDFYRSYL